jgi:CspA family cold shock protein
MPTTEEKATSTLDVFTITGIIKWFNQKKGFGFITPNGGGPNIFLQSSYLEVGGYRPVKEGDRITCEVQLHPEHPEKGFLCTYVLSINGKAGAGQSVDHTQLIRQRPPRNRKGLVSVRVKWFNTKKGYGFLTEGEDKPDIIIGIRVLTKFGIPGKLLEPGTSLVVRVKQTAKSPTVTEIYVDTVR